MTDLLRNFKVYKQKKNNEKHPEEGWKRSKYKVKIIYEKQQLHLNIAVFTFAVNAIPLNSPFFSNEGYGLRDFEFYFLMVVDSWDA